MKKEDPFMEHLFRSWCVYKLALTNSFNKFTITCLHSLTMESQDKKQRDSLQSPVLLLICCSMLVVSVIAVSSLGLSLLSYKEIARHSETHFDATRQVSGEFTNWFI